VKRFSLRYALLTYRLDQVWLPAAFWALFAIICLFRNAPDSRFDMVRVYLGTAVPLVGGILAAYAVLDDPALELRFATPTRAGRFLAERLGLILAIQALSALGFQLFALALGVDFTPLGNWAAVQLAWIVPTLALMALGCAGSLLVAQSTAGAFLAGFVWLMELLARGWLASNAGRYVLIFMGALMPGHPSLHINQVTLSALAAMLLFAAWALLHRQERYI
jgi:hypothetical protein